LSLETTEPASVRNWVKQGGKTAVDTEWDYMGMPALHVAVFYSYYVVIDFLLDEGEADINVKSRGGMTPLDLA